MGLFDYVHVLWPMPAGYQDRAYQTKDFPKPFMESYQITQDGRLLHEDVEYYTVPEEQRPGYQRYLATGKKGYLIEGFLGERNRHWIDTMYHGNVVFYDIDVWFTARFNNGQLEWIRQGNPEDEPGGGMIILDVDPAECTSPEWAAWSLSKQSSQWVGEDRRKMPREVRVEYLLLSALAAMVWRLQHLKFTGTILRLADG